MTDRSLTGFKASVSFVWSRAFSEYWPSRRRRRRGTPGISITGSAAWGSWFSSGRHVEVVLGGRGKGGPILQPIEPIKTPIHYTVEGNEMIRAASRLLWCIREGMKVLEWVDVLGAVAWYLHYLCVAEINIFAALCVFFSLFVRLTRKLNLSDECAPSLNPFFFRGCFFTANVDVFSTRWPCLAFRKNDSIPTPSPPKKEQKGNRKNVGFVFFCFFVAGRKRGWSTRARVPVISELGGRGEKAKWRRTALSCLFNFFIVSF